MTPSFIDADGKSVNGDFKNAGETAETGDSRFIPLKVSSDHEGRSRSMIDDPLFSCGHATL